MDFNFKSSITEKMKSTDLGIKSRATTSKSKITVSQIGPNGENLKEAVSEQRFAIDGSGYTLKYRGAYHKNTPICSYVENDYVGDRSTREMALPKISRSKLDMEDSQIPKSVLEQADGDKIYNFLLEKTDNEGKVLEKAEEDENGNWKKVIYDQPIYRQRIDNRGEEFTELTDGRKEDDKGIYIESFSKYAYFSKFAVGFFAGYRLTDSGSKVPNSEGIYMTVAPHGSDNFFTAKAQKSAAKVNSIRSIYNTVFRHPEFGVVTEKDITSKGLMSGHFEVSAGDPCTIMVIDSEGNDAFALTDRPSWRISKYHPINRRVASDDENAIESAKEAKEEIVSEIENETENSANAIDEEFTI